MLALARFALRRPWPVLALLAAGTLVAAAGLPRLELRTDGAAIYPQGSPVVERTLADRALFEEPEQVILLATSRSGGPLLESPQGFRFLVRAQKELQKLPGVPPLGVRSLASLVEPPKPGPLSIHTFLETVPDEPAAFAALVRRIREVPLASGLLLAPDGRTAALYVFVAPGTVRQELIADLERWAATRGGPFRLRITGPVAAEAELGEEVLRDLARLVPVMVAVVALLLWLSLRTPGGVLMPLAEVLATLVCTLGLMGWAGVPVTLVTTILPVLLMALSITDEIHLLERLQHRLAGIPPEAPPRQRLLQAAEGAYADLVRPLVLTSLTTMAGFLSFLTSSMAPLRHLGLFAGLGLLLAMTLTFTLVPALLAVLPPAWSERRAESREHGLSALERLLARRGRAAALAGALLLAAAVPGVFLLRVQDSWIANFDPRSALVTAERDFNRAFWGSYRFDVVLEGERSLFHTPRGVARLEEVDRLAREAPHVGGVLSPLQLFEAGADAYGHPLPVSALPPQEVERIGALIEILTLRVDLRHYLTPDAGMARARLFVRDADYEKGEELRAWLEDRIPGRYHLSGDVPTGLEVVGSIVGNQLRSIGWTAAQIGLLLLVAVRRPRLAAALLFPVLAAALLLFAALGYLGVPLGIATSMFAALTLGAGVDFALHYAHAYRRERAGRTHPEAVLATLRSAGRGLLWNALVLAFGFSVLAVSTIRPNASLGLLLAAAMVVSYGATVVFLPELLRRVEGGGGGETAP
jgi:predicted RND superfamily exporter protein